ncbi:MAG: glycosyltransferase family 87 protein [Candidatus Dormibacterales bacterium]
MPMRLWPLWVSILGALAVRNSAVYITNVANLFGHNDFRLYYAGAEVGLRYGWSDIYDASLHQAAVAGLQPAGPWYPLLTPAPITWLVAPLTLLGYPAAYWVWVALSLTALGAAAWYARPRQHSASLYWLWCAALGPLWFSAFEGQVTILVVAAILTGWRLLENRRDLLGGAILAVALFKPYLILLIPLALLAAGRFRALFGFTAVAAAAGVGMLVTLHPDGIHDYLVTLLAPQAAGEKIETLYYTLGGGSSFVLIECLVVISVIVVSTQARRAAVAWPVVVSALLGSFLLAGYWHPQDYLALDAAAAIMLGAGPAGAAVVFAAAMAMVWTPASPPLSNRAMILSWLVIAIALLGYLVVRAVRQAESLRFPTRQAA